MKTVLITGTSKGIGLETALAFARAGYKVLATMRNPDKAAGFKSTSLMHLTGPSSAAIAIK